MSGNAQHPVPGIIRAGGMPASTSASRMASFSATASELPSDVVPKTAMPTSRSSSHLQCLMRRAVSGIRSAVKGVTTGARTPCRRWVGFKSFSGESTFILKHPGASSMRMRPAAAEPTRDFFGDVRDERAELLDPAVGQP